MALNYGRNIPLLYLYSILIKRVTMPVIILYFLLNTLNFTQIGILVAVMAVTSLVTEVHGGIFADIHGKKLSLILHSFFGVLTMFLYFIGNSFEYFLIASVFYGLAGAFITGTRNALLYDSLVKIKKTKDFKKYNGRIVLYSHLVNALVLLAIPVIYVFNTKLPFLIGIGFFLASLITALFFAEPFVNRRRVAGYNRRLAKALREITSNRRVLFALTFTMVTTAFFYMSSEYVQPLLQISGLDIVYFGIIYALMRVIMGVGAEVTHRLDKKLKTESLLLTGFAIMAIGFLGFSLGTGIIIILAVVILRFAEGMNRIVLDDEMNRNIRSENRTTILSISSLSNSLFLSVLAVGFGVLADAAGVQQMFSYVVVVFVVSLIAASVLYPRKKAP